MRRKTLENYNHHGNQVWVRKSLKEKHRDYCLCFSCSKLNIEDRASNCPIANELYDFCVRNKMATPVWECPDFIEGKHSNFKTKETVKENLEGGENATR